MQACTRALLPAGWLPFHHRHQQRPQQSADSQGISPEYTEHLEHLKGSEMLEEQVFCGPARSGVEGVGGEGSRRGPGMLVGRGAAPLLSSVASLPARAIHALTQVE